MNKFIFFLLEFNLTFKNNKKKTARTHSENFINSFFFCNESLKHAMYN